MTKTPAITGNNKEKQEGKISKQFQSDVKVTASALGNCTMYMKLIISLFLRIWNSKFQFLGRELVLKDFM